LRRFAAYQIFYIGGSTWFFIKMFQRYYEVVDVLGTRYMDELDKQLMLDLFGTTEGLP
jgi:hypothetical protein